MTKNKLNELINKMKKRRFFFFTGFIILFITINLLIINSLYSLNFYCNPNNITYECPAINYVSKDSNILNPFTLASSAFIHASQQHLKNNENTLLFSSALILIFSFFYCLIKEKCNAKQFIKIILLVYLASIFLVKPIARTGAHLLKLKGYLILNVSTGFSGINAALMGTGFAFLSAFLIIFLKNGIRRVLKKEQNYTKQYLILKINIALLTISIAIILIIILMQLIQPLINADYATHLTNFITGFLITYLYLAKTFFKKE